MSIRVLPDFLVNQIAAGEVVERPASVIKELVENALDAGATEIFIDITDSGRTMISVIDNGRGMSRADLANCLTRHATSKLPTDDLLNINFMGFRGEALPSIASVSDMSIDTFCKSDGFGWKLDCNSAQVRPSPWESGTRVMVENLFSKTPARLKFLHGDRAEMMAVVDIVKRLAMSRPDIGFVLNNKWRYGRGQTLLERTICVMGGDVSGRMLQIDATSADLKLSGFISEPTMRRASGAYQYLFVNGRCVRDKVLVGAIRAAYMDVMHSREFAMCALNLTVPVKSVDVNVSPSKTDVHFLEPAHVRAFIIKTLRRAISATMIQSVQKENNLRGPQTGLLNLTLDDSLSNFSQTNNEPINNKTELDFDTPLGRVLGQIGNKYILSKTPGGLIITDQHAANERLVYEKLRAHKIKTQPLLTPIVITLKPEQVSAVLEVQEEMGVSGLVIDQFGENSIAIFEKPADWNMDFDALLKDIADEVLENGHSIKLNEKLHLCLANYACHHSVRAGQKLDFMGMDALLRDIENTERAGQCNHGRPVYRTITFTELDKLFERI